MNHIIQQIEAERATRKVPEFKPGDTIVVNVKVKEGDRERVQAYEGVVIARSNRGFNSSVTVRKISHGEGVERVFQLHSPSDRRHLGEASRQRASRQAVLPARPVGQGCPHRRKGLRSLGASAGGFFRGVWRGLDGLRRVLHLILLLLIFGFIIGALRGTVPHLPAKAALSSSPYGADRRAALRRPDLQIAFDEARGQAPDRRRCSGTSPNRSARPRRTSASRPSCCSLD